MCLCLAKLLIEVLMRSHFLAKRPISPEGRERLNRLANLMTGNI